MTSLYTISNITNDGSSFRAGITFNAAHPVFSGHFPGQPIVPGVVLVEITVALAVRITGKDLILKEASVIKFLQVIEPLENLMVISEGTIVEEDQKNFKVDLDFSSGMLVFAKLRGIRLSEQ